MKLYYAPGTCSLAPHIALTMAELNFDLIKVDLSTKLTETDENYTKINPKGYVPTLVLDDGTILTEGVAVLQYIADQAPEKNLAPSPTSMDRYRLQEKLNFITSEIHKGFAPLFNDKTPEAYRTIALERLKGRYTLLNSYLEKDDYLLNNTFSVADAYLYNVSRWSKFHNFDLAAYPYVAAFMERVNNLPAVQKALKNEGTPSYSAAA